MASTSSGTQSLRSSSSTRMGKWEERWTPASAGLSWHSIANCVCAGLSRASRSSATRVSTRNVLVRGDETPCCAPATAEELAPEEEEDDEDDESEGASTSR